MSTTEHDEADRQWESDKSPLYGLKVRDVVPYHKATADVVTVSEAALVDALLKTLATHRILSVPVVAADDAAKVLGVVDVLDCALTLVGQLTGEAKSVDDAAMQSKFLATTVGDVLAVARSFRTDTNPLLRAPVVAEDDAATKLVNLMWGGYHRCAVLAADRSRVASYVSQSDVVRFAANHAEVVLGEQLGANTPLSELGIGAATPNMVEATTKDTAYDVLVKCVQQQVSAVPVVDADSGALVASFSASELRALGTSIELGDLSLPVLAFLERHAPASATFVFPSATPGVAKHRVPATVRPSASLELALYKMVALRVHRLWLVADDAPDASGKPIGVVSQTDLMKVMLLGGPSPSAGGAKASS